MITCDWWECSHFDECVEHCLFAGSNYPPCGCCVHFDYCDFCTHQLECAQLVTKYLPNMFRRLVRDIRHGEDPVRDIQFIRRNTLGGKRG